MAEILDDAATFTITLTEKEENAEQYDIQLAAVLATLAGGAYYISTRL